MVWAFFVLGPRVNESVCEPVKNEFSILYSSVVYLDLIPLDSQRQTF